MPGLGGFVLLAVSSAFGELEQAVEMTATTAWCPGCGVAALPHGRRPVRVRDLPSSGRPVTLRWLKRLWRCTEPACGRATWSEVTEHVRPRASLTERARQEACRLVGEDGRDVAAVAAKLGGGWHTVMRAVRDYGRPLSDDPARTASVEAVGVDETAVLVASAGSQTQFVTGIAALPTPGRQRAQLLDVVPGRSESVVSQWMTAQDPAWRQQGTTASLYPFRVYPTALRTSLPRRCVDAFHVVRLGQAAVDDVRRRRQQETLGRRGHREDPLYCGRRLRRSSATLNQRQWTWLELTLTVGDPSGQLTSA